MNQKTKEKIAKAFAKAENALNELRAILDNIDQDLTAKPVRSEKYVLFIKWFNTWSGRSYRGDDKSERQFKALIKRGYNFNDFEKAVKNLYKNPHHISTGFTTATPELLTRPEKFEMYLNADYSKDDKTVYPDKIKRNNNEQPLINGFKSKNI